MNVSLEYKAQRIGQFNFVTLNDHIIAYGLTREKYQAKCISCGEIHTFDEQAINLSSDEYLLLKLYSLHEFLGESCDEPRESVQKVVSDKVLSNFIGDIKTKDKIIEMEKQVHELIGPSSNISVDIDAL